MNPYYNPEKLDLDMISFDEPDLSYEYNTFCFWADKDGLVYYASDSGCSCPTPFENGHDRETRAEVIATLGRIGSIEQAESELKAWAQDYEGKAFLNIDEIRSGVKWVAARLAK